MLVRNWIDHALLSGINKESLSEEDYKNIEKLITTFIHLIESRNREIAIYQGSISPIQAIVGNIYLEIPPPLSINIKDDDGNTLLHLATKRNHLKAIQMLAEAKADPSIGDQINGDTPLHLATRNGQYEAVRLLILNAKTDCNIKNSKGETPLNIAAHHGHIKIVYFLITEAGADVNTADKNGQTPLMWAAFKGHADIAFQLLHAKANLELCNKKEMTALDEAVTNNRLSVVHLLLEQGATIRTPIKMQTYLKSLIAVREEPDPSITYSPAMRTAIKNLIPQKKGPSLSIIHALTQLQKVLPEEKFERLSKSPTATSPLSEATTSLKELKEQFENQEVLCRYKLASGQLTIRNLKEIFGIIKNADQRESETLDSLTSLCTQIEKNSDQNKFSAEEKKEFEKVQTYREKLTRLTSTQKIRFFQIINNDSGKQLPSGVLQLILGYTSSPLHATTRFFKPAEIDSVIQSTELLTAHKPDELKRPISPGHPLSC